MLHPLLNPYSTHYHDEDTGKTAIEIIEEESTIVEAIGFCRGNIIKYDYRKYKKGLLEADLVKLETYKAYKRELEVALAQLSMKYGCKTAFSMKVAGVWRELGINWEYKLPPK